MTPPSTPIVNFDRLALRGGAFAGLFEGIAVARYQVLQGDAGELPRAIAWAALFTLVQIALWSGLAGLARRRYDAIASFRIALLFWTMAVMLGRSLLRDRLVAGIWLPAAAGLLLVLLVPRPVWQWARGRAGAAVAGLGIALVGTTSLLGIVPDDSHPPAAAALFLATSALAAWGIVLAAPARPRLVAACLVLAAIGGLVADRVRERPDGPNVLFVLLDTTRRDHVPPFGDQVFEQAVADLAANGVSFDQAVTVVPKTPESVASFWTGLYPYRHGVRGLYDRLDTARPTLAETFRDAGYSTTGLIDNGWLTRGRGFGRGFERFRGYYELTTPYGPLTELSWWRLVDQLTLRRIPTFSPQVSARRMTDAAIDAIARAGDRPFFVYAHYFEPHWPYFPPDELAARYGGPPGGATLVNHVQALGISRGRMIFQNPLPEVENEKARRLYRAEIDDTLAEVRRLLDALERQDLTEETIVVFTADHGHSLGEHGYYFHHGEFLYEDSVRIPLVLRWPGRIPAGRKVAVQVRSIDVAPTLYHLAGVRPPADQDGRSLERLWQEVSDRDLPAFIESDVKMFDENLRRDVPGIPGKMRALRTASRKLILNPRRDGLHFELFDLTADPGELENLADRPEHRDELQTLRKQLWALIPPVERERILAVLAAGGEASEDSAGSRIDLEQLRSLGYIN